MPGTMRSILIVEDEPLIAMMLGQALVGSNNPAFADEAIGILRTALAREPEAPIGYTNLAMAYGRKGNFAEADLASHGLLRDAVVAMEESAEAEFIEKS